MNDRRRRKGTKRGISTRAAKTSFLTTSSSTKLLETKKEIDQDAPTLSYLHIVPHRQLSQPSLPLTGIPTISIIPEPRNWHCD